MAATSIYDFSERDDWSAWEIENDTVMGGQSTASLERNDAGNAVFSGHVSLENNGGFASVQHRMEPLSVEGQSLAVIRLRGDGKRYQFRLKADAGDRASYVYYFETTGEWQTVTIPLGDMKPTFRGRDLDRPNFKADHISEVRFFIGNKKAQDFSLEIDRIWLE